MNKMAKHIFLSAIYVMHMYMCCEQCADIKLRDIISIGPKIRARRCSFANDDANAYQLKKTLELQFMDLIVEKFKIL